MNCRLLLETRRGALVIPAAAVQRGPQGQYVYAGQAGQHRDHAASHARNHRRRDRVEVKSGVAAGDLIVTDGQDKLQEGGKVTSATEAARSPGQNPPDTRRGSRS